MADGGGGNRYPTRWWLWSGLAALLLVMAACVLIVPALAQGQRDQILPISLRAQEEADYSLDPRGTRHPPLQLALIGDVLRDLEPGSQNVEGRIAALMEELRTPVATEASSNGAPLEATRSGQEPTAPASTTPTASPAGTIVDPLESPSPSPTGPTPTEDPLAEPTATPLAPTATNASSLPTATDTLVPPTATPTPDSVSCSQFDLSGFDVDGQWVRWDLSNDSGSDAILDSIYLNWPGVNESLVKIELGGNAIWDEGEESPPTNLTGGWKGGVSRTVRAESSEPLTFQFEVDAQSVGYNLTVEFENGCSLSD